MEFQRDAAVLGSPPPALHVDGFAAPVERTVGDEVQVERLVLIRADMLDGKAPGRKLVAGEVERRRVVLVSGEEIRRATGELGPAGGRGAAVGGAHALPELGPLRVMQRE